jgi:hypothetical protein
VHLSDASFLGKLLVLPANGRLVQKVIARYKHSSLFGLITSNEGKKFYKIASKNIQDVLDYVLAVDDHSLSGLILTKLLTIMVII